MTDNIRVAIFDIDGTLYRSVEYEEHISDKINEILSELLGISKEEARARLQEKKRIFKTVSKSVEALGVDRRDLFNRLAERLEIEKHIPRRPDVAKSLRTLRERGVKVVLHTNSGRKLAERILNSLGVDSSCYDMLVTSDEVEPKPSQDGYRYILEKTGAEPWEAVYVGDRYEVEIKPAEEIGMKTIIVGEGKYEDVTYAVEEILRWIRRGIVY